MDWGELQGGFLDVFCTFIWVVDRCISIQKLIELHT